LKRHDFTNRVAVVGSGLSHRLFASIGELANKMEGPCGITLLEGEKFWDFFDRAYNSNPDEYHRVIKESFGITQAWDARAYWHIANIPFKSFVTLNFDDQLPLAYQRTRNGAETLFSAYPAQCICLPPALFGPPQRLVAVHGYRNENDPTWNKKLILRAADYKEHYYWDDGEHPPFLYLWWYPGNPSRQDLAAESNNHFSLLLRRTHDRSSQCVPGPVKQSFPDTRKHPQWKE
jgi:hypothetical protein